jgi:metal-responsive CopG/Arc/MetJ family transcriptional regulator
MANRRVQSFNAPAKSTVRVSVSLPANQCNELEQIAQRQRVSLAWVIRDAVQAYLVDRWPLLDKVEMESAHKEETKIA